MLSTCTFIQTMLKKLLYILFFFLARSRVNTHIHVHAHKNMFVTENYMHIEHRHTKGMGCLKQHNTGWKQHMERYIYYQWFLVTPKRDNI